ncbi:hypothetical protein SAMN05216404_102377 [Nitrosospira multiformis]|uniref:Uncharacterized protein n=1 Tax=Nitrosospira multiformis TaxID=1231 RepID=A0A1H8DXA2_9PROT|nr:hypothetical protein [Nitrosospira multiformis]SEN11177.1 hypothetical protein SAMN05216404_102377 [Nitrosospira multiformis]
MKEAERLDNHVQAYTHGFPYSEENHLMLDAGYQHVFQISSGAFFNFNS